MSAVYPCDAEWREVQCDVLTYGYIRNRFGSIAGEKPREIIELCIKFLKPTIFVDETEDPVNSISDEDRQESNRYKQEGNMYFKARDYDQAIVKYKSAIYRNPNNHLLFSNLAYCEYLLSQYNEALVSIRHCIDLDPTVRDLITINSSLPSTTSNAISVVQFIKGWFRYGLILEKVDQSEEAAIAYSTARDLSEYAITNSQNKTGSHGNLLKQRRQCTSGYEKVMKLLESKDHRDPFRLIGQYFQEDAPSFDPEDLFDLRAKQEAVLNMFEKDGYTPKQIELNPICMKLKLECRAMEFSLLHRNAKQAQFRTVVNENGFECEPFPRHWMVSWTSMGF